MVNRISRGISFYLMDLLIYIYVVVGNILGKKGVTHERTKPKV